MNRIDSMTGMRSLAAIWVILFHSLAGKVDGFFGGFIDCGARGVDVFFVLSGFIMMHVYGRKLRDFAAATARDFYWKRFAKIYPSHLAVLLGFVAVVAIGSLLHLNFDRAPYSLEKFLYQVFLLNGIGITDSGGWNFVSWTISSEFVAYLVFPLLAPLIARLSTRQSMAAAIGIIFLMFGLAYSINDGTTYFLPWNLTLSRILSEFLLGALTYKLYRHPWLAASGRILAPALFMAIAITAGLVKAPMLDGYLVALFTLFIIALAHDTKSLFARSLQHPVLVYLGEISYSTYLVQNLIFVLLGVAYKKVPALATLTAEHPALLFAIPLVISLSAGALLYTYVEGPCQQLIRRRMQPVTVKTAA